MPSVLGEYVSEPPTAWFVRASDPPLLSVPSTYSHCTVVGSPPPLPSPSRVIEMRGGIVCVAVVSDPSVAACRAITHGAFALEQVKRNVPPVVAPTGVIDVSY